MIRSYGTSSSMSIPQLQTAVTPNDDPTRVAVENLIASIKSKQLQENQRQADRKILDIIYRVLGRTIDLVYDEDEQEQIQQEIQQQIVTETESKVPMIIEEEDVTITPRAPDVSRMDATEIGDDNDEETEDEQDLLGRSKSMPTTAAIDDDYERIDMSRDPLYRHILLGITNEDLLSVQGTHIDVPSSMSTKTRPTSVKPQKPDETSVHHFCIQMVDEKDILPKEIRAITQLYHQRARFRHQLPTSATYHKHGQLPNYPIRENDDEQLREKS